jgi:hypothetical protein
LWAHRMPVAHPDDATAPAATRAVKRERIIWAP